MFKSKMQCAVMAAALLTASPSFAAFTMEELADVTKVGLKAFSTKEPTHSKHSIGFKSWVSGEDAKVKIYVTHDGMSMEFNYLCHKHDGASECHEQ